MSSSSTFAIVAPHPSRMTGLATLRREASRFDGYAIVAAGNAYPAGAKIITWSRLVREDGTARAKRRDEHVAIVTSRPALFGAAVHLHTNDVVSATSGDRPDVWLRWVLAHLGAVPGTDAVHYLPHGERVPAFDDQLPLVGADSKDAR